MVPRRATSGCTGRGARSGPRRQPERAQQRLEPRLAAQRIHRRVDAEEHDLVRALPDPALEQRECLLPISEPDVDQDRKSTRLNSSHQIISYAVFCLKKKKNDTKLATGP